MRRIPLATAVLLLAAVSLEAQGAPSSAPPPHARLDSASALAAGRRYTEWFYNGLGDSLIAHSSAAVREKITAQQLEDFNAQLVGQVGMEAEVLAEHIEASDSLTGYLRVARFEMMEEPLVVAFTLDSSATIYGFFIRPKSAVPPEDLQ